jgi:hypothetical protein
MVSKAKDSKVIANLRVSPDIYDEIDFLRKRVGHIAIAETTRMLILEALSARKEREVAVT